MTTTIDSTALFFGAPASLTVGGTEVGATLTAPKVDVVAEQYAPVFQGAGGPISGAVFNTHIKVTAEMDINEITAQKLTWSLPGSSSASTESVGQLRAGLSTTLGADPALGATTIRLASVTTATTGDFLRIGTTLTEAACEVVRIVTIGTAGATDTVVENSAGGGLLIDHASGETVVTVTGTLLSAPAAAGATNIKVDSVTGLTAGDFVRIGYVGHYETRVLTVVGTATVSGTGITFAEPLTRDHSLDEWVVEVTALGDSTITWSIGRVGSDQFRDVVLDGTGLDGRHLVVTISDALADGNLSVEMSDSAVVGSHVIFTGYYDGDDPTLAPVSIVVTD